MILMDVRDYIAERRRVSLKDLENRFEMDRDSLRPMLDHWIGRRRVRRIGSAGGCTCSGCSTCDTGLQEIYEWTGTAAQGGGSPACSCGTDGRHGADRPGTA